MARPKFSQTGLLWFAAVFLSGVTAAHFFRLPEASAQKPQAGGLTALEGRVSFLEEYCADLILAIAELDIRVSDLDGGGGGGGGGGGNGSFECGFGLFKCGDEECADLESDVNHCGACNNACPEGQTCDFGVCVVPDADGDGFTVADGDCDDDNPFVHPNAEEVFGDGIDNDCDGTAE